MKITLRIQFPEDASRRLRSDPAFTDAEADGVVLVVDANDERFDRFLDLTGDCAGSWFNPVFSFTRKELDSAAWLQVEARKHVRETQGDYECNYGQLQALEPVRTAAGREVRCLDRITLTRVPLRPGMVAILDQWTEEWVLTTEVARAFARAGFTGWETGPVIDPKTGMPHEGMVHLKAGTFLPPASIDRTTPPADGGGVRQLGCLVYQALDGAALQDFNRTAEDWSSNAMPLWVVSQRVRQCFLAHKFRGWAFRPVLIAGSDLHQRYVAAWDELFEKVESNPRNFF